jgi:L-threonylcarbamoyladenylate synthase
MIHPVDREHPDPRIIDRAAAVLREGGLVAFPTETVYGLGANALDEAALRRIFVAKGRPSFNPLIAHVAEADDVRRLVSTWPEAAERLARRFWPGPLTLVLPRLPEVPRVLTAGLETVAVRLPAHPVARALIRAAGFPVAAPSANRSTGVSPTTASHVARALGDRVDLILDAGPTEVGIESTVVSLAGVVPILLRPGSVSLDHLREAVGEVRTASEVATEGGALPSPGMLERHYAPRARMWLFPPEGGPAAAEAARSARAAGETTGAVTIAPFPAHVDHPLLMPSDPAEYARGLYAALHALDDAGCDRIFVQEPPRTVAWAAVLDRLRRASHR